MLFLGTAGAAPSAHRGAPGHLVRRGGDRILVDCGEGTQRQLLRSGVGLVDVDDVLITHCHADHVLGLPGMLKTFALRAREAPLQLYGPAGLADLMTTSATGHRAPDVQGRRAPAEPGDAVERDGYRVHAFATDHHVPSVGYALVEDERPGRFDIDAARELGVPEGPMFGLLQHGEAVTLESRSDGPARMRSSANPRPGRTLVFSGDTRPCKELFQACIGADVLVHEATFLEEEADRAAETGHTTALQAGRLAQEAGVRLLALTHISTRHPGREILAEARSAVPGSRPPARLRLDRGAAGRARRAAPGEGCVSHFDALAPEYDRLRPAGDGWTELAERTLAALAGTTRLVDVGCGTGRFAVLAAERLGARVWGVDRSAEMLHEAKRRPGGRGVGWRRADAEKLPFRDGWFDGAHSHLVLHLVDDLPAAVAELARVVSPGGRLVVGTFAPEHFREFFLNPYFPSIPEIDLARFPDPGRLCGDLASAGFAGAAVTASTRTWRPTPQTCSTVSGAATSRRCACWTPRSTRPASRASRPTSPPARNGSATRSAGRSSTARRG